jgi:hypothetical protein
MPASAPIGDENMENHQSQSQEILKRRPKSRLSLGTGAPRTLPTAATTAPRFSILQVSSSYNPPCH